MSLTCSKEMQKYFDSLTDHIDKSFKIAQKCREKGYDPIKRAASRELDNTIDSF